MTYRIGSHSSSDDADRYRDKKEWESWKKRDPILRFQRYLEQKGIWDEALVMATPLSVFRSAAATILSGAVLGVSQLSSNPLADGDRRH